MMFSLPLVERVLPTFVFLLLGLWTYALFVHVPYSGFDFNSVDGQVIVIYNTSPEIELQVGDRLLQVGPITWDAFKSDLQQSLFREAQPGQVVPLVIQREKKKLSVMWLYPGPTLAEVWARLISEWWFAYAFWFAGTLTMLFLRPKHQHWWLLVAFNYLTAVWLAGESSLSRWHVWGGAIKLGALIWPCVPVYLHLHWVFPKQLGRSPTPFWLLAYLVAFALMIAEMFQLLPRRIFFAGFLLAVGGSACLLALHFVRQPAQRREVTLLVGGVGLALLANIAVGLASLVGRMPASAGAGLLFLSAWPLSYFYVAARHQLGAFELRANRLISLYVFLILLGTATLIFVPLAHTLTPPQNTIWISWVAVLLTALVAVMGFTRFERWVERHILGMPLAPTHLLEEYATQITTSLSLVSLVHLLQEQILPSLLVRQALLLEIDEKGHSKVLGTIGLDHNELPTSHDVRKLLTLVDESRTNQPLLASCPWLSVILPLQIEDKTIGFWLLGRRDPDDFYAQSELKTLQAIANQTAIALTNIVQAKRLRSLYQTNIDRQESERAQLARELHDHVLNQLAVLYGSVEYEDLSRFEETYHLLAEDIRQIVKGLRPAMLSYGLHAALDQLVDDLAERQENGKNGPLWEVDLDEEYIRYPSSVEQHLFRIVQQACENVLHHAQADTLWVTSRLAPQKVELEVRDNGIGFEGSEVLDITYLLSHRHFGIVSIWERAELIGAKLDIESEPNKGTRVSVTWEMKADNRDSTVISS